MRKIGLVVMVVSVIGVLFAQGGCAKEPHKYKYKPNTPLAITVSHGYAIEKATMFDGKSASKVTGTFVQSFKDQNGKIYDVDVYYVDGYDPPEGADTYDLPITWKKLEWENRRAPTPTIVITIQR